jgi:hypothetical protein
MGFALAPVPPPPEPALRRAWDLYRERLLIRPDRPGRRPAAFWRFDAGRPDLAGSKPEREPERVAILRVRGDLTEAEVAELERRGEEAARRIGTAEESWPPGDPDNADRLAVRIAEAARGTELSGDSWRSADG